MRKSYLLLAMLTGVGTPAAAATPDITGMWNFRYSEWATGGRVAPPPALTAEAADLTARRERAARDGYVRSVANMKCLPPGFPAMMLYRTPIEILAGRGRISITAESAVEPRTIYLDRPQPDPIDPSWNGHSIGHWQGDELIVETAGMNGRGGGLWNIGARLPPTTEQARYVERYHLEADGKTLDVSFTVTDPAMYAKPYSVTVHYDRMPDDAQRMEAVCEVDLDALKTVDLRSIRAVDAEAARMLDPAQQYNPIENAERKKP